jgi:hypothetical protein
MKPRPTTKIVGDLDEVAIPKPRLQGLGSWHTEVVPAKGGSVQVLHADGNWYCGKLSQYDQVKGQWHIVFDDGDHDWYSLPDRDVRLLRERARGSWATCLQTHQIRYFECRIFKTIKKCLIHENNFMNAIFVVSVMSNMKKSWFVFR